MAIQSKKAKEIDAWIKDHPNSSREKQGVEIDGKIQLLPSYDFPISLLQYNHANGRFNLEIQEYETKLGRKLDPSEADDIKKIKELLLQDEAEAKKLKEDLKRLGAQSEVAAITYDGVVVNGNRRMATIAELHSENPSKWERLWAVRLPQDISEKDLWKIEAGLQLSKAKVADYGPVNNLLMIKEGKKAGLTNAEIAASMYGWTEKQVSSDIERLDLIDYFLQFMGGSNVGNYGLIKKFQLHEHFINLQKYLVERLKTSGAPKKEILKELEIAFLFLRAKVTSPDVLDLTHMEVREICKILQDNKLHDYLTESFDQYKDHKQIPVETLSDNLDIAKDAKKNKDDEAKPGKLVERAVSALSAALEGLKQKNAKKPDEDLVKKIANLEDILKKIKSELNLK